MFNKRSVEVNVNLHKEPWFKLEFGGGGGYYYDENVFVRIWQTSLSVWKKFSFAIILAIMVLVSVAIVIMTATFSKEDIIRVLAVIANSIWSPIATVMGEKQIIPMATATIVACFIAGYIFFWRCRCQWGGCFTIIKLLPNPFSPSFENRKWKWKEKTWTRFDPPFNPPSNIKHRFLANDASADNYEEGYRLRNKFIAIDVAISVTSGLTLWIGFMHIIYSIL